MAKKKAGRRLSLPFILGVLVFISDALSKYLVVQYIPKTSFYNFWYPYGGLGVFKNFFGIEFSINHVTNHGAAWGSFSDHQELLLYFRIFLVLGLLVYLLAFNKHKEWEIPLWLIVGGAVGNIVDVFVYGHVVDMFHFVFWGYDYPVFNIADSFIFIGIVWMILSSWKKR